MPHGKLVTMGGGIPAVQVISSIPTSQEEELRGKKEGGDFTAQVV